MKVIEILEFLLLIRSVLKIIKDVKSKDFETILFNSYAKKNKVGTLIFDNFWYPVETKKDYDELKKDQILKKKTNYLKKKLNAKK